MAEKQPTTPVVSLEHEQLGDLLPCGFIIVDQNARIAFFNRIAEQQFGYARGEILGREVELLLPQTSRAAHVGMRQQFQQTPSARPMGTGRTIRALRRDGSEFPVEIGLAPHESGRTVVTIVDISEPARLQTALKESEERYAALFESLSDGVGVIQDERFVFANLQLAALTHHSVDELMQIRFIDAIAPDYRKVLLDRYRARVADGPEPEGTMEVRLLNKNGTIGVWAEIRARRIHYHGRLASLVVLRDVTRRKEEERHLEVLANQDPLTGLANRRGMLAEIDAAVVNAQRRERSVALLYLDLDGFKGINDCFGHAGGDLVLQIVSRRLREAVRKLDNIGRLGGDEFAVLIADIDDGNIAAVVAAKILSKVSEPIDLQGTQVQVGVSIGIATYPYDGQSAEVLLRHADDAMYRVKQTGKQGYCYYSGTKPIVDIGATTAD